MSFMASYTALWLLVAFLALVAIGLLQQVTTLRRTLAEAGFRQYTPLVIGSVAPAFSAIDGHSGKKRTSNTLYSRTSLVVFVSPQCSTCRSLVYSLPSQSEADSYSIVTVCKGNESECRDFLDRLDPGMPFLFDSDGEIGELYGVSSYPTAVVVDAAGRVRGYGYPGRPKDFKELVATALREVDSHANPLRANPLHMEME